MEEEVELSSSLPKMMARFGEVKLRRDDVIKVVGRLFRLRVEVNLISNVLDTPEIFWSEPELEGLYNAIRGLNSFRFLFSLSMFSICLKKTNS